jgi:hypothetical protein
MAQISKRFENPRGRVVGMEKAEISSYGPSCGISKPVPVEQGSVRGQRMTHFMVRLRMEDGRSIEVGLSQAELEQINQGAAEYAKQFPWAEPA